MMDNEGQSNMKERAIDKQRQKQRQKHRKNTKGGQQLHEIFAKCTSCSASDS